MSTPALEQYRHELLQAADARLRPRSSRARRHRVPLLAAAVAVLALGGGAAGAVTLLSSNAPAPTSPYDPATTSPRRIVSVHPLSRAERAALKRQEQQRAPVLAAQRYFSALRRPATPADRVPGRREQTGIRLTTSGALGRVYIRHTARETCVISFRGQGKSSTGSCAPTKQARTRGVLAIEQCFKTGPPQRRFVAGIVPDTVRSVRVVRAGAQQASTTVHHNGFIIDTIQPFDTIQIGTLRLPMPPVTC